MGIEGKGKGTMSSTEDQAQKDPLLSGAAAAEEEEEEENATLTFVSLGTTNPNGTGSRTGVAFYNTNSTGQLAFLDNIIGIFQTEFSPQGSGFREWEWKGGTLWHPGVKHQ